MLNNLRTRLTLIFVALSVVPLVIIGLVLNRLSSDPLQRQALALQKAVAVETAARISNFFEERANELHYLIETQGLASANTNEQKALLEGLLAYQSAYQEMSLIGPQGQEQLRVSRSSVVTNPDLSDYSQADIYLEPRSSGEIYYSDVRFDSVILEPLITVSLPITNLRTGSIDYLLVAQLRFKSIWDLIAALNLREGEDIFVMDTQNQVVAYRNPSVVLRETTFALPEQDGRMAGLFGEDVLLAQSTIQLGNQSLIVVAQQLFSQATLLTQQISTVSFAAVVITLVAAIGLAVVLIGQIVRPILRLGETATAIQGGDLTRRVAINSSDEIGQLASTFNSMANQLQGFIGSLEERVAERTRDMATTIEVGKLATSIYSQHELLPMLVEFIREQFGLYYTQIYLIDEAERYAVLRAGTGQVGEQLVARNHRLDLSQTSLVARAVESGETVLVSDTTTSSIHKANDLLPNTRSEVTIPLKVGRATLGVLDMQADVADTFNQENVPVFEAMASQIAAVLRGNQAYNEAQTAAQNAEAVNRRLTEESWKSYLGQLEDGQALGYQYDLEAPRPLKDSSTIGADSPTPPLVQPVTLRGQQIGTMVVQDDQERVWKPDELLLMEDVAQHVAQALEQYRAFDEIKRSEIEREVLLTELQHNANLIRTVIDGTPDWILAKDHEFRYMLVNEGYASALGLKPEDMLGKDDIELGFSEELVFGNSEKGIRGFRADDEHVLRTGERLHNPYDPATFADGSYHVFDTQKMPLRDTEGQIIAVLGFARDITERQQQEEEVRQAREEAEILYKVSAAINEANDPRAIVNAVQQHVAPEQAFSVSLAVYSSGDYDTSQTLRILGAWMRSGMDVAGLEIPIEDFSQGVETDPYKVSYINDVNTDLSLNDAARQAYRSFGVVGTINVPMFMHGKLAGTLGMQTDTAYTFTDRDIRLLGSVSEQAAAALERMQQEEEIRQSREEAEILYLTSAAINEARDEQGLVQAVATYPLRHDITSIGLTICENYDYDTASSFTLVGEIRFDGAPSYVGATMPADSFPIFRLLDRHHINICEDVATDPLFDEQSRQGIMAFNIRSYVFAPLTAGDRWMGNLGIYSDKPQSYNQREIRILSGIRDQLIAAFERMRLTRQAERRAAELATVARVSTATTTILNIEELLQAVSDLTKESFNLYHAHIYLLDEKGEALMLAAGAGEIGRIMKAEGRAIPMQHRHSLVARAARDKRGLIASDVTQDPDFLPNPMLPATRSELTVPMLVGGELIGVLDMQSDTMNRFTETDRVVMTTLADQIAIAIQNAQAFKVQTEAAERLREVDRMKTQFLANMSHELRTPLNSIIGYAEVLLDGIDGELGDEAIEDVEAIHGGGKHLLSMINDILDLAKIDAGQMFMDRHETDLLKVIDEVIHTCQILVKDKGIELTFEKPAEFPTVYGDPVRLRQIVYNLVNNAIKFTEKGDVTLSLEQFKNDEVCVTVKDTGIGMTEKDLSVIFERFRQVDGSATRRAGGTGLGLAITRQLVQMHDGDIHVTSEPGVGSTFWFTLPVFVGQNA